MRHYIEVRWRNAGTVRQTLVNLHKIVTVVDSVQGCKIHFQGYCLEVANTFDEVMDLISAADRPPKEEAIRTQEGKTNESSKIH